MNRFQRRWESIPCIFHSIFLLKLFVGFIVQIRKLLTFSDSSISLDMSGQTFSIFSSFLSKFFFTFKNLLVHLFYIKRIFSLCNILWAHFDLKVSKISSYLTHFLKHVSVSFELISNSKIFWYEILPILRFYERF